MRRLGNAALAHLPHLIAEAVRAFARAALDLPADPAAAPGPALRPADRGRQPRSPLPRREAGRRDRCGRHPPAGAGAPRFRPGDPGRLHPGGAGGSRGGGARAALRPHRHRAARLPAGRRLRPAGGAGRAARHLRHRGRSRQHRIWLDPAGHPRRGALPRGAHLRREAGRGAGRHLPLGPLAVELRQLPDAGGHPVRRIRRVRSRHGRRRRPGGRGRRRRGRGARPRRRGVCRHPQDLPRLRGDGEDEPRRGRADALRLVGCRQLERALGDQRAGRSRQCQPRRGRAVRHRGLLRLLGRDGDLARRRAGSRRGGREGRDPGGRPQPLRRRAQDGRDPAQQGPAPGRVARLLAPPLGQLPGAGSLRRLPGQADHRGARRPALTAEAPPPGRALGRGARLRPGHRGRHGRRLPRESEHIFIPLGAIHRLENPGNDDVELIEVQLGSYLGEDDIVRLEDAYHRA
ncbi:putative Peptide chain release factor 2 [Methylorubrum extorquens]|uniref:Putative Peptide chain release factor 2 n=1 Tax=Methylorubrum extorquens TaxID=408 RepID=A0A2N9AKZ0_METEX|nr:putative Peptide chain release factor 2 [Methylorubrum extorquens]